MMVDEIETAATGTGATRAASGGDRGRQPLGVPGAATTMAMPTRRAGRVETESARTATREGGDAIDAIGSGIAIAAAAGTPGEMIETTAIGPRGAKENTSMTDAAPETGTMPSPDATSGGAPPRLRRSESPPRT